LALRRPTLDDVFLALTGHGAEQDDHEQDDHEQDDHQQDDRKDEREQAA
jgi:hypothetical protein